MTAYLIRFNDGSYSLDFEPDFLIEEGHDFEKYGVEVVKLDNEEIDKFFYAHKLMTQEEVMSEGEEYGNA